ncbi:hypothetical protein ScalyP_jg5691 [Parmales sp. scaly parma]|nr:hypothetical protein ScalyP_jg5691 [Parmales sp. scaly parma]
MVDTITPPSFSQKPSKERMKQIIAEVQTSILQNEKYTSDNASAQTKKLSDEVRDRLRDLGLDRYKFLVQVVLGEQRTEGVHVGCRCLWDADTDNYASQTFTNDSMFCVVTAYWIYQY